MDSFTVDEHKYLDEVCKSLPRDHPLWHNKHRASTQDQRVMYTSCKESPNLQQVLELQKASETGKVPSICVIENISASWIAVLGRAWNFDATFFTAHAERKDWWIEMYQSRHGCHIGGIISHVAIDEDRESCNRFPRGLDDPKSRRYPPSRISCSRVSQWLYLILVDLPCKKDDKESHGLLPSYLVFRSLLKGCTLGIPQLHGQPGLSVFEGLDRLLHHDTNMVAMFPKDLRAPPVPPELWAAIIARGFCNDNLQTVENELHMIAFQEVRHPNLDTNNKLHDLRKGLTAIREQANYLVSAIAWWEEMEIIMELSIRPLVDKLQKDADDVYQFLMETFDILLSSISIQDSQLSLKEAKRNAVIAKQSQILTMLAAFYLPLTLATGIYGMNIVEISDHAPTWWMVVLTFVVLLVITLVLLSGFGTIRSSVYSKTKDATKDLGSSLKRLRHGESSTGSQNGRALSEDVELGALSTGQSHQKDGSSQSSVSTM